MARPARPTPDPASIPLLEASELLVARRRLTTPDGPARTWTGRRPDPRRTSWTWGDLLFLGVLNLIVVFNGMDLLLTLVHISDAGWAAEGNLIARVIGENAGPAAFALVKILAVALTIPLQWYLYRQVKLALSTARSPREVAPAMMSFRVMLAGTAALFSLYLWVVQNNVRVIGLLDTLFALLP